MNAPTNPDSVYLRDRSFYNSRPSPSARIVYHRPAAEPNDWMAHCDSKRILLYEDTAAAATDVGTLLCRRCFPGGAA